MASHIFLFILSISSLTSFAFVPLFLFLSYLSFSFISLSYCFCSLNSSFRSLSDIIRFCFFFILSFFICLIFLHLSSLLPLSLLSALSIRPFYFSVSPNSSALPSFFNLSFPITLTFLSPNSLFLRQLFVCSFFPLHFHFKHHHVCACLLVYIPTDLPI